MALKNNEKKNEKQTVSLYPISLQQTASNSAPHSYICAACIVCLYFGITSYLLPVYVLAEYGKIRKINEVV